MGCPNCGDTEFHKVKDGENCEKCGYKNSKFKVEPDCYFIYCRGCGFHRTTKCTDHPPEMQEHKGKGN